MSEEVKKKTTRKPRVPKELTPAAPETEISIAPELNEEVALPDSQVVPKEEVNVAPEEVAQPINKVPDFEVKEEAVKLPEVPENQKVPKEEVTEVVEEAVKFDPNSEIVTQQDTKVPPKETYQKPEVSSPKIAGDSAAAVAVLRKLNPYLPDNRSKWVAEVSFGNKVHEIFRGSYARAERAAKNYNESHHITLRLKKIRSK